MTLNILMGTEDMSLCCPSLLLDCRVPDHFAGPLLYYSKQPTIMTLSFQTDKSGQTVQTQIRLLLEEQCDQGLHCLLFHLHHFDKILFKVWPHCLNFR